MIINSAIKRFKHYGISKTTMQEIATDADMSVGSLYLYFKNKEDIVLACAGKFAEHHLKIYKEILEEKISPQEKLKKYILNRFYANQETRNGSPHDKEITKMVIKVYPNRIEEESQWLFENIFQILTEGINLNQFKIADISKEIQIFLYAISYFFPLAINYIFKEPEKKDLIMIIEWFLEKWEK